MPHLDKPFTFDRVVRILFGIGILVGLYLLFDKIKYALFPFITGWLLAYLINPLVDFLQYRLKCKNRIFSVIATLLLLIGILTLLVIILIPAIQHQIDLFKNYIVEYQQRTGYIAMIPISWQQYIKQNIHFRELLSLVSNENWKNIAQEAASKVWRFLNGSISWIISIISYCIVLLYMFFILIDYKKITNNWINIIPKKYHNITNQIYQDISHDMNQYFRGQALVVLCVSTLFSVGFSIIGLPLGILLGLFVGLLNFVPYLQLVGLIPTILLCLLRSATGDQNFWVLLLLALIVFAVVQILQDAWISPKIIGKVTGLNPAIMLLSLSIFNALFGIIGMVIALPISTFIISYYRRFILEENKQKKID
ncbi:MAG: AI-2E family transporter [Chitinophagaceae bacterium]